MHGIGRTFAVAASMTVALVACSAGSGGGAGSEDSETTGSVASSPSASLEPGGQSSSPVEGTWRGGEITFEFLVENGITEHDAGIVLGDNDAQDHIVSTVRLQDGTWQGFISPDGGPDFPAQSGTYTVEDDEIVMHDALDPDVRYVYRWSIDGQDRLHIEVVSIDNPFVISGVEDWVYQFALYEATPMERVD
jgi:hypothetical protein